MSATIIAVASSVVSLAVSIGLAYAAGYPGIGNQVAGRADVGPVIVYAAAVAIVLQWVAFIPAFAFQTEKYYDLTGSVTYISVTLATLAYRLAYSNPSLALNVRALVSSVLVVLWALRLGSFLVKRIMKAGKDGRFDEVKPFFARFLAAWTIQVCSASAVLHAHVLRSPCVPLSSGARAMRPPAAGAVGLSDAVRGARDQHDDRRARTRLDRLPRLGRVGHRLLPRGGLRRAEDRLQQAGHGQVGGGWAVEIFQA